MSTLLHPFSFLARASLRSGWSASKALSPGYFSYLRQQSVKPAVSVGSPRLQWRETPLLQFVQQRVTYATHRSRLFRQSNSGRGSSGWSSNGGGGNPRKQPFLERIPDSAVIWGILGINGLVYLAWQRASYDYQTMRDPNLHLWLRDNFTTSLRNLREGRIWTLITSAFSHEGTGHIFVNALTFFFMAPPVLSAIGKRSFFVLYLGGGLVSSLTSLWFNNVYKPKPNYSSHGASGAMYAVISFLACVAPKATFQLYGIIPIPAWLCVSGLFLYDAYSAMNNKQAGTDTAGHVGGVLGGIVYYLALRFRIF